MLERERPLGPRARERGDPRARAPSRSTTSTKPRDPLELLVGDRRIPARAPCSSRPGGDRRCEVDELEQPVDGVADLGRREPALPGAASRARRAARMPDDPLGVVAVRAALEERERAVREPAHVVERRRGHALSSGERGAERRQRRAARAVEERELAVRRRPRGSGSRQRRSAGAGVAVDADEDARAVALELDGRLAGASSSARSSSRSSTQPIGVVSSAVRSGSIAPETISRSIARVIAT